MPPYRSRFLWEESLPSAAQSRPDALTRTSPTIGGSLGLPLSDYTRARHTLDRLWGQVGPRYFPGRAQPTVDPAMAVPSGAVGITYPRTLLSPQVVDRQWRQQIRSSRFVPNVAGTPG